MTHSGTNFIIVFPLDGRVCVSVRERVSLCACVYASVCVRACVRKRSLKAWLIECLFWGTGMSKISFYSETEGQSI